MAGYVYEVAAHNYALDSDNKVHDDAVAARYGFRGGLVPGAADVAYLARAAHAAFGDAWLDSGSLEAKFVKPVYHGETVRAEARPGGDADRVELVLTDPRGETCAVGQALRRADRPRPRIADFPGGPLPPADELPAPTPETFAGGHPLGAWEFAYDALAAVEETRSLFVEPMTDSQGRSRFHPALYAHLGNQIVRNNVRLGPWVHTASRVSWFAEPADGDRLSLRGHVADTYEKRGHVMTDCDLALFANEAQPLAVMRHTAIIRLAGDAPAGSG